MSPSAMCVTGRRSLAAVSRHRTLLQVSSSRSWAPPQAHQPSAPAGAISTATSVTCPTGRTSLVSTSSSPSSALHSFSSLMPGGGARASLPLPLTPASSTLALFDLPSRSTVIRASAIAVHNHVPLWPSRHACMSSRSITSNAAPGGGERSGTGEGAKAKGDSKGSANDEEEGEAEGDYDEAEEELEPEEKISPFRLVSFLLIAGLAVAAIGATVMELMPSHMAPQSIMSRAHDVFQGDPDIANHFGTPLKVYGRDNNRHREGRRNYVEHVDHEDPADGSKRTRVRFNVEGPNGHGVAYAEVSNKMDRGEWVYLCVQDMQTGHVITLHDNRALLLAQAQAGSDEEKNAFRKMLGQ